MKKREGPGKPAVTSSPLTKETLVVARSHEANKKRLRKGILISADLLTLVGRQNAGRKWSPRRFNRRAKCEMIFLFLKET